MKALYSAVLTAALTTVVAPTAFAGVSTDDAFAACKSRAGDEFAQEGSATRIKLRGTSRKAGAIQVRLQVYPRGSDSFKATCSMDRQSGEVIMLARDDTPDSNLIQTAER